MKKIYAKLFLFLAFTLVFVGKSTAQCTPDMTLTTPGFSPNPLPNGCVGQAYSETVSFLFPNDTTVTVPPFGSLTIPFDSFVVAAVLNVPPGLTYACNVGGSCTYVTNPPNPTYGCVEVSGTPTTPNAVTDSIEVVGEAWVTILGSPTPFSDTVRIALLVNAAPCGTGILSPAAQAFDVNVVPNPANGNSVVRFNLDRNEVVEVAVIDVMGREVMSFGESRRFAGLNEIALDGVTQLPAGIYSVRVETRDLSRTASTKLIVTN